MLQRWLRACALVPTQGTEVIILSLPSDTPQERRVLGLFCLNMDVFTTVNGRLPSGPRPEETGSFRSGQWLPRGWCTGNPSRGPRGLAEPPAGSRHQHGSPASEPYFQGTFQPPDELPQTAPGGTEINPALQALATITALSGERKITQNKNKTAVV